MNLSLPWVAAFKEKIANSVIYMYFTYMLAVSVIFTIIFMTAPRDSTRALRFISGPVATQVGSNNQPPCPGIC